MQSWVRIAHALRTRTHTYLNTPHTHIHTHALQSTLFNAIVENGKAAAANFPFCTIEPNTGIVTVPDARLQVCVCAGASATHTFGRVHACLCIPAIAHRNPVSLP